MQTQRQLEIINKSINIIAEKGIQGLTIKNLSKEIGVTEPAIYRHFKNKIAILLAILDNFQEMSSFMNDTIKDMNDTAVGKIEFLFTKIIDIFTQEPAQISVVFSEELFKNEIVLREKIVDIMNSKEKAVEQIILEGQNNGEIRTDVDYKMLALIVIGSLRFRIKSWNLRDENINLPKKGQELVNSLKTILKTQ